MLVKDVKHFEVRYVSRKEISTFIETWHYSGNINGCISDYCFGLYDDNVLIGALFYGRMAMAGQYKKFGEIESDVTELRRLCCIDDTPKNTESYFIGSTLRWLKRNTKLKTVVSYADIEHGHSGIIYKASNFVLNGKRSGARVILLDGKRYHDKSIRSKYNGVLKPYALRLISALEDGSAVYVKTAGKYCYTYELRR